MPWDSAIPGPLQMAIGQIKALPEPLGSKLIMRVLGLLIECPLLHLESDLDSPQPGLGSPLPPSRMLLGQRRSAHR